MVPQPYRPFDLINQGFGGLGSALEQRAADAKLDAPGDPLLDAYFDRLLKGEDPAKLAHEFRQSGGMQLLANYAANGPQQAQSPAGYVPDAGMVGNQPTLGAPGQFNPAGGPGVAAAQGGLSGAAAGAARPAPVQQPTPEQANIGPMTGMLRGQPVQGMQGRDALVMNAQPMNAPTGGLSGGASWTPTPQRPQAPTGGAPPAQAPMPEHKLRSVREQQRLMQIAPTLEASRSREAVAKIKAESDNAKTQLQSEAQAFIAVAKEKGLDERSMRQFALGLEGLDDKQQVAVLNAATKLLAAQTAAGASMYGADKKAQAGTDNEQLKNAQKAVGALRSFLGKATGADKYTTPEGAELSISEAQQSLRDWEDRLRQLGGVPLGGPEEGGGPVTGGVVTPKAPIPKTPGKAAPVQNKLPTSPPAGASGLIEQRNKTTGRRRWVDQSGKVVAQEA